MAGRCRKKLNLSRASSVKSSTKPPPEIPYDIVELIISRLSFRDSIRASLVCKQWFIIAFFLRKKPMWLMFMPIKGYEEMYQFFDPWNRDSYRVKLPELVQESRMCYSGHGWLLLYRRCDRLVFFFSPYTRESIKLPTLELRGEDDIVAFSGPPTSPDCLVFTVSSSSSSSLAISTCCVRGAVWKTVNYPQGGFLLSSSKVVVCKGLFYCLGGCGGIGIYDPETFYWRVFEAVVLPGRFPLCNRWCSGNFVAEYKGDVYFLFTRQHYGCKMDPTLHKLRLPRDWRSRRSGLELVRVMKRNGGFQGMTFLAGSMAGSFAMDVATMRNAVCYPDYGVCGRTMRWYSLDDQRNYPNSHSPCDWEKLDAMGYIWIEAPEDVSVLWSDWNRKIFNDLLRSEDGRRTAADLLAYF